MTAAAATVVSINTGRLECSACGATAKAGCDCGVAYVPAGTRAAAAVAANPQKSDRAIAAEIGVSDRTINRARKKSTASDVAVEKRTGRDGKKRSAPKAKPRVAGKPREQGEVQRQASINVRPDDWAAFKRRADAQGVSAASVLGMLVRDHLGTRAPGRPEPTISNPVAEVNAFHREIVRFANDLSARLIKWIETGPPVDANGKAALMQALYLCGDECAQLAQKLDGR